MITLYHVLGRRAGTTAHVPNVRMNIDNRAKKIDTQLLPTTSRAVQIYEQNGGRINEMTEFGHNPIANNATKCAMRMQAFTEKYSSFDHIFSNLVNGNSTPFKNALKFYK